MIELLNRYRIYLLVVVLGAGAVMTHLIASYAAATNGSDGFPLDDPWIHLQFARNLHDFSSFSYFKREMVTSGSTSPLYTFLLALGFVYKANEMTMSYFFGMIFLVAAGVYMYRVAALQTSSALYGLAAALLLVLEPRMQWATLSGMETTLFIFVLVATLYHYKRGQQVAFGIFAGLLIWARPEAVIFYAAILADVLYRRFVMLQPHNRKKHAPPPESPASRMKRPVLIAAGFITLYFIFNLSLSGSFFPNTFSAKLKYYGGGADTGFAKSVFHFLADGNMLVVSLFALIGIGAVLFALVKRKENEHLVTLLFPLGLFVAYWVKLPYLYQEGRYMMPLLPFVILLAVSGMQRLLSADWKFVRSLRRGELAFIIPLGLIVVMAAMFAMKAYASRVAYAESCKYITDRQVKTGLWLQNNTPIEAVVATHDIGAIAFYSRRKIVDMVGLVSPEMIERIGSLDKLKQFLVENRVTHVAVLRNWFEIVNQRPLFSTNDREPGEIMEVFAFDAARTHFTPQQITQAAAAAGQYLYAGQFERAGQILQQAIRIDPLNSKLRHLMATLYLGIGNFDEAVKQFNEALRLNPDFVEARIGLAQVATSRGDKDDALQRLNAVIAEYPELPVTYRVLADVYTTFKIDSTKAAEYMATFKKLEAGRGE